MLFPQQFILKAGIDICFHNQSTSAASIHAIQFSFQCEFELFDGLAI
jgi:hypothetical protein